MTIQPQNSYYAPNSGVGYQNVEIPHIDVRAPTIYDHKFPIGKRWINQENNASYTLTSTSSANGEIHAKWIASQNQTIGQVTLAAGTATVNTTAVTANSLIFLTVATLGTVTAPKAICVSAQTAGTSFVITSADNTDTSVVNYLIIN